MSITLQVNNIYTDIFGDLPSKQWLELERKLSFRPQGYQFSVAFNKWIRDKDGKRIRRVWDGWKRQFWRGKKRTYFPTGLFSLVQEYLKENNVQFSVKDVRLKPPQNANFGFQSGFEFWDYQVPVIDNACKVSRGIIKAATGSGKTVLGAGIIQKLGVVPFVIFVTSIDLLTQTKEKLESVLTQDGRPIKVGQVGGGVIDIKDVNVITVQTAVRALGHSWKASRFDDEDEEDDKTPIEQYREQIVSLLHNAKGAISDEIQRWRADTCQIVNRELKQSYFTYGLSATPWRDEGDDMLIQACFGKPCAEISASELILKGKLVRPDIKMIHLRQPKAKFKTWHSIYKEQVVENEYYNKIIANIANSYIQNGRLVLVLVKQINHGKTLESMIPGSIFLRGESPKKQREDGLKSLRNKYISCIISTQIFDEGVDVQALDTVLLAGQGKSKVRAMQRIGRIMRTYPGKTKATAIDFCIHQKYLQDHAIAREKMYRSEPEYHIENIDPTEF